MPARRVQNTPLHQALKRASKELVRAVGGVEAAAGFCRAGFRRLSEYGAADTDTFMPVDVIADLEAVAHGTVDYPQVTRLLCREAGGVFVPLPQPGRVGIGDLHAAVARHSRKAGAVTSEVIEALGDGVIEPHEAESNQARIMDAVEELMALHVMLGRIAEEG